MTRWTAGTALFAVSLWIGLVGVTQVAADDPPIEEQLWIVRGGTTTFAFDLESLSAWGLKVGEPEAPAVVAATDPASERPLVIQPASTLTFGMVGESLQGWRQGQILHLTDLSLISPDGQLVFSNLSLIPADQSADSGMWLAEPQMPGATLELHRVKAGFDPVQRRLTLRSPELRVSAALADQLGNPQMAGAVIGSVTVQAYAAWIGGALPEDGGGDVPEEWPADDRALGGDMTYCQLYGLYMPSGSRIGDIVGLSVATTAWNIGDQDLMWFPIPNEEHPFIVMNLYRLKNDRFEQIGQSHIKHGFYALGSHQCGGPPCTFEPGHGPGNWLGTGCTDTYSASLNAVQSGMGPRFEVNPWTGYWYYPGSHMDGSHAHDAITHRLQVYDDDLDPAQNVGATYYSEAYYVLLDDIEVMNSAAWKPVTVSGTPGGSWSFGMSGATDFPNSGFAIKAWTGATQTFLAQELPVVEFESPDGRSILMAKATDQGGGIYHYEYALLNVDMDRQVGAFTIPVSPGLQITNIGFHGVFHHGEPLNSPGGVPIDNAPWTVDVTSEAITWSTTTNPIRWGTMYNFRFDANSPPTHQAEVTLRMFKPGTPETVVGQTLGTEPVECPDPNPDANGDGVVDAADLATLLGDWGVCGCCITDLNSNGTVDAEDLAILLGAWGPVG